jgi:phospholipase/carboxylesterase
LAPEITGPHAGAEVLATGQPLEKATAAMIMVHGRGATARDILSLAAALDSPQFAYLAPQAKGNTWYPNPFIAPIHSNEPWLSSAITLLEALLAQVEEVGIPAERTMLLGFSQGACLTTEFVARHARRYGGVAGLSGGLIGPDGTPRDYPGSLDGTPIFLGCSDVDPHIPKARVLETERVLSSLGGIVTARLYPNMGHMVIDDELEFVRKMMLELRDQGSGVRGQ